MKKLICLCIGFACHFMSMAQQQSNPIIYVDGIFGYAGGHAKGWTVGGSFNIQNKKDLFSFRVLSVNEIDTDNLASIAIILPLIFESNTSDEYAILYGRRFLFNDHSLSFSLGASTTHRQYKIKLDDKKLNLVDDYIGIPFEVTMRWFKPTKTRYRAVYGLVPVGKPTGFGRSFAFKLFGSISERSFIGFGISVGFGFHKKY